MAVDSDAFFFFFGSAGKRAGRVPLTASQMRSAEIREICTPELNRAGFSGTELGDSCRDQISALGHRRRYPAAPVAASICFSGQARWGQKYSDPTGRTVIILILYANTH